jgi:uncharacterized membrane protein YhaH (DUF805 family)
MAMDFGFLFTSTVGRINRAKWWIGMIILAVISVILGWFLRTIPFAVLVLQLVLFYPAYAVNAKRFQDRGRAGILGLVMPALGVLSQLLVTLGVFDPTEPGGLYWAYSLAMLAVAIWYLVDLGILKGSTGTNEYGADPLGAMA